MKSGIGGWTECWIKWTLTPEEAGAYEHAELALYANDVIRQFMYAQLIRLPEPGENIVFCDASHNGKRRTGL